MLNTGGSEKEIAMDEDQAIEVKEKLRTYLRENFPAAASSSVGDDTSLLEEGIVDSMGILSLVTFLEDEFGMEISDDDLVGENFDSISALQAFVERGSR